MKRNYDSDMYDENDSSSEEGFADFIRTDEEYLYDQDNQNNMLDERRLLSLIFKENFSHIRKTKKNLFSIMNLKSDPVRIIKLILSIFKSNFNNLNQNKKTSVVIFVKNYFDKIIQLVKKVKDNEEGNEELKQNENRLNNVFNIIKLPEINDLLFILVECLNADRENVPHNCKEFIKESIKNLIMITSLGENKKGQEICNMILSDILKAITQNHDQCLNEQTIINFLHIYECVITSRSDLIYDNETFDSSLFLFEFIFNNISNIRYQKSNSEEDEALQIKYISPKEIEEYNNFCLRKSKIELLKHVVESLVNYLHYNLNLLRKTKIPTCNNFYMNNVKLLSIIEYILYLNAETFSFTPDCYKNLIQFEKSENKIIKAKLIMVQEVNKLLKILISCFDINLNAANFNSFCSKLFRDYVYCIGELNKEYNISLINNGNFDEIDFNSFFISILNFLIIGSNLNGPKELFRTNQIEIFRYLILPLLRVSIVEKESFFIDSTEYVTHIWDFTFEFKSDTIKSKILKLVMKLCDIFDDFTQFMGVFYTELLIYTIRRENKELNLDFQFKYIHSEIPNNIFIPFLNSYSKEELLENVYQVLATLQEKLFISNRTVFNFIDDLFPKLFSNFILNESSEFIRSKSCAFCYSNVLVKLKDLAHDPHKTNMINFSNQSFYKEVMSTYINFLIENVFFNISDYKNYSLNYLCIEFLNELLFEDCFLKNSQIKNFFASILSLHMNKFQKLITLRNKIEMNSNSLLNNLIIKLSKNYFTELESEMFILFNYLISEVSNEVERYYKIIKSRDTSKAKTGFEKSPLHYNSPHSTLDFIHALYEIVKNCHSGKNQILKMNIFNKYVEVLLVNSKKMMNFRFEEDLMKINLIILEDITVINDRLYNSLIKEYFSEMKNQKFDIRAFHLDLLFRIMKLTSISNEELILNCKKEVLSLFNLGLTYFHKNEATCLNSHFYLCTFMISFILNFSSLNKNCLDLNDYKFLIQILVERIKYKSREIYTGPLACRFYLLFHLITIILYEENNLTIFISSNVKNFEFLLNKTLTLCDNHPTASETSITLIFCFRILSILFETLRSNPNEETFKVFAKLIEYTIQQLSYLTFKNIPECVKDETELQSTYKYNPNVNSFNYRNFDVNKKFFGGKNNNKVENIAEECNEGFHIKTKINELKMNLSSSSDMTDKLEEDLSEEELEECSDYLDEDRSTDSDLFMRDLEKEDQLKEFNEKMTVDIYLKRKRMEYSIKYKQNRYNIEKALLENQKLSELLNNTDEFATFSGLLDGIKIASNEFYNKLMGSLPNYILELLVMLRSWKKVSVISKDNSMTIKKQRKIMTLKRTFN